MDIFDDTPAIDEGEVEALVSELPHLMRVKSLADQAVSIAWFSRLGSALRDDHRQLARDYLDGLGLPHTGVALVSSFEEAGETSLTQDQQGEAWEIEEQLRMGLIVAALENVNEQGLQVLLTHVRETAAETIREAALEAAALWEVDSEALVNLAVGGAVRSLYLAALAEAAGAEPEHPLLLQFELFKLGRWPIGITGSTLNLF